MRILITGGQGQLATSLASALAHHEVEAPPHAELEVTDEAALATAMARHRPDLVINTAAFHRVDACEAEVARSFQVNGLGPLLLARACAEHAAVLLHMSTDYVFGGQSERRPLAVEHPPAPLNVYGVSKLAGEHLVRSVLLHHLIVRSCGLYGAGGATGKGDNFVLTMLRLARERGMVSVVNDQHCTPTYARDLADGIVSLVDSEARGTFHVVNDGACTWFEFAREIFAATGLTPELRAVTSGEFPTPARRPPYSVLDTSSFKAATERPLRPWQDALRAYLAELGKLVVRPGTAT